MRLGASGLTTKALQMHPFTTKSWSQTNADCSDRRLAYFPISVSASRLALAISSHAGYMLVELEQHCLIGYSPSHKEVRWSCELRQAVRRQEFTQHVAENITSVERERAFGFAK